MSKTTIIPIETGNPAITKQVFDEGVLQKLAMKISSDTTLKVLDTVYREMETRNDEIMGRMNELLGSNKVAIAVKINDEPIKNLKHEAHPLLADMLSITTSITPDFPLLVGPAGCGKTMLAEQIAEGLGLDFYHLNFTAGVSETWLFGRQTANGFVEGSFSKAFRLGGIYLADEMDSADANLLLSINTALSNGVLYNPINGETYKRHEKFYFIGAANTFGKGGDAIYTGRNRLDRATLDRALEVKVGYIKSIEDTILTDKSLADKIRNIRKEIDKRGAGEVLSYRAFRKANVLSTLGYSHAEVIDMLTISWPDALKKEVVQVHR